MLLMKIVPLHSLLKSIFEKLNSKIKIQAVLKKCEKYARMAEQVDALVSKTSGISRAGSIPAPGTVFVNTSKSKFKKTVIKFVLLDSTKKYYFYYPKKSKLKLIFT